MKPLSNYSWRGFLAHDWRAIYEKFAPALVVFCILCSMFASIGVYAGARTNRAQDVAAQKAQKARADDTAALIDCIDEYTTDLAGTLPPVRKASAVRDEALIDAMVGPEGIGGLLVRAQRGVHRDPKKTLAELVVTFNRLKKTNAKLVRVRAANPYPPPPSQFCQLPN